MGLFSALRSSSINSPDVESNFNPESLFAELRPHLVVVARVEQPVEDRGNLAEGKAKEEA